jgi:hypothetical protein
MIRLGVRDIIDDFNGTGNTISRGPEGTARCRMSTANAAASGYASGGWVGAAGVLESLGEAEDQTAG